MRPFPFFTRGRSMVDWNKVIEQSITQAPAIIGAIGLAYWRLSKRQDEALRNQRRIEEKVNGNHKQAMRAIRAQGQLEGIKTGKRIVREDLEHATRAIAKASKRGTRRSTDK